MTTNQEFNLIGGPQDGGRVKEIDNNIPQTIYLNGIVCCNDCCQWAVRPTIRFKYCYVLDGSNYKFQGNKSYGNKD